MTLALEDIRRIANLSHLELNDEEAVRMQGELNNIFKMIERIQAVDTDGVDRENNMKNAPEQADGHFLVPQVIE